MKEGSTRISTFECYFQAVFIGLRIQLPLIATLRWERFVSPETFRQQGTMRATVIAGQAVIYSPPPFAQAVLHFQFLTSTKYNTYIVIKTFLLVSTKYYIK